MLISTLTLAATICFAAPLSTDSDIVDIAAGDARFSTLVTAVQTAELVDALKADGPLTVFAPTNEAFAKLDPDLLQRLLQPSGRAALTQILTYHVLAGRVDAAAAVAAKQAKTLAGPSVKVSLRDGRLQINDSKVLINDIDASNGVIHVIDTVLLPPDLKLPAQGRPVIGIYDATPSPALASQLGIDRKTTRLLDSVIEGSEADRAGLLAYDILLEVDGVPCSNAALKAAKQRVGVGGTLELLVLREGQRHVFEVGVGSEEH